MESAANFSVILHSNHYPHNLLFNNLFFVKIGGAPGSHDASSSNLMAGMDASNSSGDDSSMSCDVDVDGDDGNNLGPNFNQSLLKLNIFQQQQHLKTAQHLLGSTSGGTVRHFPVELLNPVNPGSSAKPNHSFSIESLLSSNCR